ncbi:hypothetical protein Vretimale_14598 [Volvox reticuliferus]|uniref:C2 domain-containing protein n=1 Tax=Volvox reticuliferus TaxID=1737510 RepID=A0A8J4FUA9_9CHLO|nr:hypothetical protein Vretifemale_13235 [Volvox reticuliferus]GIM11014.1 hypothetical protein Vretimale_14598 [Volvox reticuliferus]
MAGRPCLRPWKDEYQLLCSIDSVSGEMKSISPFQVPKPLLHDLDDQAAASIESHFKVIETISDYAESKSFRARLSGTISSFWNMESSFSALDSAKVNSKDIFGYYSLIFTKSRVVVNSAALCNLPLTKAAERAIRTGRFRDQYGDMVVVGYITGGEAEAVLRVTNFQDEHRDSIRKALRVALQDNAANNSPFRHVEAAAASAAGPTAGGCVDLKYEQDNMNALKDCTTTLLSRRTGVTHQDQLSNPSNFPRLLLQLTKAAENTGVKISALCYRVELFSQVPEDVLGFARVVVDENVNTLQRQFAQVQFVHNSCEAHLAPGRANNLPDDLLREVRRLHTDACAAMQRFAQYKGYRDVGQLSANDSLRRIGSELLQRFDDFREKMRVAEWKEKAPESSWAEALHRGPVGTSGNSVPSTPTPWINLPRALTTTAVAPQPQPQPAFRDGILHGRILALRNFAIGKVLNTNVLPYIVIKLDSKVITSPPLSGTRPNAETIVSYDFHLDVSVKLLTEDVNLVLEVYDKNLMRSDKFLGSVTVPLRKACGHAAQLGVSSLAAMVADGDRSNPIWYPVERQDSSKYKCRGELSLSLRYSTDTIALQAPHSSAVAAAESSSKSPAAVDGDGPLSRSLMAPLTSKLRGMGLPPVGQQPQTNENPGVVVMGYPRLPPPPNIQFGVPTSVVSPFPSWSSSEMTGANSFMEPPTPQGLNSCGERRGPGDGTCSPLVKASACAAASITTSTVSNEHLGAMRACVVEGDADDEEGVKDKWRQPSVASSVTTGSAGSQQALTARLYPPIIPTVQSYTDACITAPSQHPEAPQPQAGSDRRPEETRRKAKAPVAKKGAAQQTENAASHQTKEARVEPEKKIKKARRGPLRLIMKLLVAGVVLGSSGAAVVIVGEKRFGVDVVAESRRLGREYGRIVKCTAGTWFREGRSVLQAWGSNVATRLQQVRRAKDVVESSIVDEAANVDVQGQKL